MEKSTLNFFFGKKISILLVVVVVNAYSDSSFEVPINHPVYGFLSSLVHPVIINGYDYSTKPYSRNQVISLLKNELAENPNADKAAINRYLKEFAPDSGISASSRTLATVNLRNGGDSLQFYPAVSIRAGVEDSAFSRLGYKTWGLDSLTNRKDGVYRIDCDGIVQGHFGGMALYFKGSIITQYNTRTLWKKTNDPHNGEFYADMFVDEGEYGHGKGADDFETYLKFPLSFFDLKVGRTPVAYGISDNGGLLLSGNSAPFFNIQASKNIKKLSYNFVWGRLVADTHLQKRYLYAKRIGYQPLDWLNIGFTDEVITINRDLEPIYFLPAVPFFFAEHYVGDLDNRLMSFDMAITLQRKFRFYTEVMMDDIRNLLGFFDTRDVANKWGVLTGIRVANPLPWLSSAQLEFVQIEPWVFTTSVKENRDSSDVLVFNYPVHSGKLVGTQLGPNSRNLRLTLRREMSDKFQMMVQAEQIWKGWKLSSFVDDINGRDSTGNFINMYKDFRFYPKGRNRTVITAEATYQPKPWNLLLLRGCYAHENAIQPGNYFSVTAESRFNF